MRKTDIYRPEISKYLQNKDYAGLTRYLISNSNLPGPRGNLELASLFADHFSENPPNDTEYRYLLTLAGTESKTNDPEEFAAFAATQALGAIYLDSDIKKQSEISVKIRAAMNDGRWRMREAAAMAFQRIAEKDFPTVKKIFGSMFQGTTLLEKRAFLAALAHPPILKDRSVALYSLKISENILDEMIASGSTTYKHTDFPALSKGLEYAVSVFIAHAPAEGFRMLKRYAGMDNKAVRKIVKSNIGKNRLKKFTDELEEIAALMENAKQYTA